MLKNELNYPILFFRLFQMCWAGKLDEGFDITVNVSLATEMINAVIVKDYQGLMIDYVPHHQTKQFLKMALLRDSLQSHLVYPQSKAWSGWK